jgi:hypothetical protein
LGAGAKRRRRPARDGPDLDGIAWRVLSDLLTPDGAFATLPPDGLQHMIQLRLEEEAARHAVSLEALGLAFERAMLDLTGAGRRPV